MTRGKFAWQIKYFAVPVSGSMFETVRNYIRNQEVHYTKQTFAEEYLKFKEKYNFEYISAKAGGIFNLLNGLKPVPIEKFTKYRLWRNLNSDIF